MIAVVVNAVTAFIGGLIGLIAKKGIPERLSERIFQALALFVMYVGITGALGGKNTIVILISLAVGTLIGELLDLDKLLQKFGDFVERKIIKKKADTGRESSLSEAFVTTSLLQCVGAYILVAGMKAGLEGDNSMIYSKASLDFVSSIVLAASMGPGVLLAALTILVVTGAIVLGAQLIEPLLGQAVIADMVCVGSLVIIAQSLNMLKVTDIKIMNLVPSMFLPIGLVPLYNWISGMI